MFCGRRGERWGEMIDSRAIFLLKSIGFLIVEDKTRDVTEDAKEDRFGTEKLDELRILSFNLLE